MSNSQKNKPKVVIANKLNKISEVIDIDGNKLDHIKGNIIERKKVFNMAELDKPVKDEVGETAGKQESSLSNKIEKKINDKINDLLDKKIDEILNKIF